MSTSNFNLNSIPFFITLRGWSGIIIGLSGIVSAWLIYKRLILFEKLYFTNVLQGTILSAEIKLKNHIVLILITTLVICFISGWYFSYRYKKKNKVGNFESNTKSTLLIFLFQLLSGGTFMIVAVYQNWYALLVPFSLFIYGIALMSTLNVKPKLISVAAGCFIVLGICSFYFQTISPQFWKNQLIFWGCGFGLVHFLYGALTLFKK